MQEREQAHSSSREAEVAEKEEEACMVEEEEEVTVVEEEEEDEETVGLGQDLWAFKLVAWRQEYRAEAMVLEEDQVDLDSIILDKAVVVPPPPDNRIMANNAMHLLSSQEGLLHQIMELQDGINRDVMLILLVVGLHRSNSLLLMELHQLHIYLLQELLLHLIIWVLHQLIIILCNHMRILLLHIWHHQGQGMTIEALYPLPMPTIPDTMALLLPHQHIITCIINHPIIWEECLLLYQGMPLHQ